MSISFTIPVSDRCCALQSPDRVKCWNTFRPLSTPEYLRGMNGISLSTSNLYQDVKLISKLLPICTETRNFHPWFFNFPVKYFWTILHWAGEIVFNIFSSMSCFVSLPTHPTLYIRLSWQPFLFFPFHPPTPSHPLRPPPAPPSPTPTTWVCQEGWATWPYFLHSSDLLLILIIRTEAAGLL